MDRKKVINDTTIQKVVKYLKYFGIDNEILINSVANSNKSSYFCITIESRCGAHSKTQKMICGEIGGLKKEDLIIIYISIRYNSVVSPKRITETLDRNGQ